MRPWVSAAALSSSLSTAGSNLLAPYMLLLPGHWSHGASATRAAQHTMGRGRDCGRKVGMYCPYFAPNQAKWCPLESGWTGPMYSLHVCP